MNKLIVVPSNPPRRSGPATQADGLHAAARSRRVEHRVVGGRAEHLVPAAGRSHQSRRHACPRRIRTAPIQRKTTGRRVIQSPSPGKDGNFAVLATEPNKHHRGLRARRLEPAPADEAQREAARRAAAGDDRGLPVEEQGRHGRARPDREARGLQGRHEVSDAADRARRPERPGSARVLVRSRVPRRATATSCSRSTIAAAPAAATRSRRRSTATGATSK